MIISVVNKMNYSELEEIQSRNEED